MNFYRVFDPLADKILICSALIAFTAAGAIPAWFAILIVARDFFVTGLRLYNVSNVGAQKHTPNVGANNIRPIAAQRQNHGRADGAMGQISFAPTQKHVAPGAVVTGKINTAFQMIFVILVLIAAPAIVTQVMMWIIVALTVISTVENIVKLKKS